MSNTTLISLRIPTDLLKVVDDEAKAAMRSRAQMIVWRLRRGYGDETGRIDGVDGETAEGSAGGRGTEGPAVPDVRKAAKPAKRLHPVHALRDELAGGGRPVQEREVEPGTVSVKCVQPGHKPVQTGNGWWCMTCYRLRKGEGK